MKKLLFLCYCGITLLCGNTVFGDEPAERRAQFIIVGKLTFGDDSTYTWLYHNENRARISFDEKNKLATLNGFIICNK
jgi:hypothetical protein